MDEKKREKKDWVIYAQEILEKYKDKIVCPTDLVISDGVLVKVIDINKEEVPKGWAALDIGPETIKDFSNIILKSGTVFLGGPMGKFEDERFTDGSKEILNAMKKTAGETIIAGGDTIDVARRYGSLEDYSHVSLAGGATLEFLAGKELPALKALME